MTHNRFCASFAYFNKREEKKNNMKKWYICKRDYSSPKSNAKIRLFCMPDVRRMYNLKHGKIAFEICERINSNRTLARESIWIDRKF